MSIRTRLLLLTLLATALPALLALARFFHDRDRAIEADTAVLVAFAQRRSETLVDRIQGTAQLLYGLGRARDLQTDDREACSAFLSNVRETYPQYTGILTIKPDGRLFCDSLRTGRDLDLRDRAYFKAALASRDEKVVLEPTFGRLTGVAVLQIAYPVRAADGSLQFVLLASLNLQKLFDGDTPPLPGASLMLFDRKGAVYARSHEMNQVDRVTFDAATDKVDFRYYGTRELISMYQADEGVVIANGGTGQKLVLLDTDIDDLSGRNFIFHMGQVYEDHLDQQLGVTFETANVWSRVGIPDAGTGTAMGASDGIDGYPVSGTTTEIAWVWGSHQELGFDPSDDKIDFGFLTPQQVTVQDNADGILLTVVGNNQTYLLDDMDFADLRVDNILAADAGMIAAWAGYLS